MKEYGFDEIYNYITEGGTVTDKDTIRRNSERLLEIVHYEFQEEGRKRARVSWASKESIDAGIASEEARFKESVNQVIDKIAKNTQAKNEKRLMELGLTEIYEYITDNGKTKEAKKIRKNAERLLDFVHYEFEEEGRKRARLSRTPKETIQAAIKAEETQYREMVDGIIARLASVSEMPHWQNRVNRAHILAGIPRRFIGIFRPFIGLARIIAFFVVGIYLIPIAPQLIGLILLIVGKGLVFIFSGFQETGAEIGNLSKQFMTVLSALVWPFNKSVLKKDAPFDPLIGFASIMILLNAWLFIRKMSD